MGVESPFFLYAAACSVVLVAIVLYVWELKPLVTSFGRLYDSLRPLVQRIVIRYSLMGIVLGSLLLALAGPTIERGEKNTRLHTSFDLIFLVDSSLSMTGRANLDTPTRLERAQEIIYDLLDRFPEANAAVCEFTNRKFCRAPLGSSRTTVLQNIENLAPEAITGSGSSLIGSLRDIPEEFDLEKEGPRVLVVLSDGGGDPMLDYFRIRLNEALENITDQGIYVISIGIGGDKPVPIALRPVDELAQDGTQQYEVVFSSLAESTMIHIAAKTDGVYFHEEQLIGSNLSELTVPFREANVLQPLTRSIAWIPGIVAFVAGVTYLVLFRKKYKPL